MHRRARHLNARHAGAGLVFDARRITGLSDSAAVATWSDASGNGWDATQSSSTLRPLYKLNVQGGQPGVLFDGANDLMSILAAGALAYSKDKGYMHIGGAGRDTTPGNANTPHFIISFSGGTGLTRAGLFTRLIAVSGVQAGARRLDADSITVSGSAGVTTSFFIGRSNNRYTDGTIRAVRNGVALSTVALPSSGNTSNTDTTILSVGQNLVGHILSIYVINVDINASLQRRLDHSMGFAFKIQTS